MMLNLICVLAFSGFQFYPDTDCRRVKRGSIQLGEDVPRRLVTVLHHCRVEPVPHIWYHFYTWFIGLSIFLFFRGGGI